MKKAIALIALAALVAMPDTSHARRGKAKYNGEQLVQPCLACHGPDGGSLMGPMPSIAGQGISFLDTALKGFRDGKRQATIMDRLMKGYTDGEIAAMAVYLSGLQWKGAKQDIKIADTEASFKLYKRSCGRCHVNHGRESKEPDYPIVAGQWLDYMKISIADIKSGIREVDSNFLTKLEELKPEEVDLVLEYFAAQH